MSQFRVPDMHCDGCVRSLTKAIQAVDSAASVQIDLEAKLVRVDTVVDASEVAAAIEDAGFTADAV